MLGRTMVRTGVVAAAIGVPYVAMNDGVRNAVSNNWNAVVGSGESAAAVTAPDEVLRDAQARAAAATGDSSSTAGFPRQATLTGPPADDFLAVMRFDVPPEWVRDHWSRVTTTLADLDLEGLRVPLVTGHELSDVAGSLTYYFDAEHKVQRLEFEGYTGDPQKLVTMVTSFYGLRQETTLGAGLYLAKWNGHPTSVLRVQHAPVVLASSPNSRYEVRLEINQPGHKFGLSEQALALLRQDQGAKRWQ